MKTGAIVGVVYLFLMNTAICASVTLEDQATTHTRSPTVETIQSQHLTQTADITLDLEKAASGMFTGAALPESLSLQAEEEVSFPGEKAHVGDEVRFIVKITWKGDMDDVTLEPPNLEQSNHFEVNYISSSNTVNIEKRTAAVSFIFVMECMEPGEATIEPIEVSYIEESGEKGVLTTKPASLTIFPAPQLRSPSVTLIAAGVLALLACMGGAVVWKLKASQSRKSESDTLLEVSPYQRILAEASTLDMLLLEGNIRGFYEKIGALAKGLVSVNEGEKVKKYTCEEMKHHLEEQEYDEKRKDPVVSVLTRCENVQFGGEIPPREDNERILREFKSLIETMSEEERTEEDT